ncbi:hypothetical protein V5N11_034949 [Cardamine amara subsp. amara]|uniref:Reverse transcriptase zinc-binding domain-containing protein n=1 Tax=Cardamine amara subsp. amara TaxID=228776 RepID=A0ABD1AN94_CARAN
MKQTNGQNIKSEQPYLSWQRRSFTFVQASQEQRTLTSGCPKKKADTLPNQAIVRYFSRSPSKRRSIMHPKFNRCKEIWSLKIAPKLQVFLWKILQGSLPIGENLIKRGMTTSSNCFRCGELETIPHLFFECQFAKRVWEIAPFSIDVTTDLDPSFHSTIIKTRSWRTLPPTGVTSTPLFPWICWAIWKARNQAIFEDRAFAPQDTLIKAITEAKEWKLAQTSLVVDTITPSGKPIKPQPPETITCHTDAAWRIADKFAGLGWTFGDQESTVLLQGSSSQPNVASPLVAEALAASCRS